MPKTRTEYWIPKIEGNAQRDQVNKLKLEALGWKVITVWECELKKGVIEETLHRLVSQLIISVQ